MAMFGNAMRPRMMLSEADLPVGSPPVVDPMAAAPKKRGGLFGRMRDGWNAGGYSALGDLGAAILAANGNPIGEGVLGFRQLQRERAEDEAQNEYRRALAARASAPDYQNVSGVGLVETSATGGPRVAVAAKPEETSLIREMRAAGIDPASEEGRMIIARAARGYQYSPEMQAQTIATQTAIAQARAAARPPAKGGRITATAVDEEGNRVGWNGSAWVPM